MSGLCSTMGWERQRDLFKIPDLSQEFTPASSFSRCAAWSPMLPAPGRTQARVYCRTNASQDSWDQKRVGRWPPSHGIPRGPGRLTKSPLVTSAFFRCSCCCKLGFLLVGCPYEKSPASWELYWGSLIFWNSHFASSPLLSRRHQTSAGPRLGTVEMSRLWCRFGLSLHIHSRLKKSSNTCCQFSDMKTYF